MVTPRFTARSRAPDTSTPALLKPLLHMSITRRGAVNPLPSNNSTARSMALPIAVLPSRGGRVMSAMLSANRLASAGSPIRVQGTTVSSVFGPAHWTSVTAIALLPPTVSASAI